MQKITFIKKRNNRKALNKGYEIYAIVEREKNG
jgi:hypothetical protein